MLTNIQAAPHLSLNVRLARGEKINWELEIPEDQHIHIGLQKLVSNCKGILEKRLRKCLYLKKSLAMNALIIVS